MHILVWVALAALAILALPYLGWAAISSRLRRIESHLRNEAGSHTSDNELIATLTRRVWELENVLMAMVTALAGGHDQNLGTVMRSPVCQVCLFNKGADVSRAACNASNDGDPKILKNVFGCEIPVA